MTTKLGEIFKYPKYKKLLSREIKVFLILKSLEVAPDLRRCLTANLGHVQRFLVPQYYI